MFDLLYITNVCETVTCESSEVSVYEGLEILGEITSNCDILTPAVPPEYKYINEAVPLLGVQFTYKGKHNQACEKISMILFRIILPSIPVY